MRFDRDAREPGGAGRRNRRRPGRDGLGASLRHPIRPAIYNASPETLARGRSSDCPTTIETLLIVGHNPGLQRIACSQLAADDGCRACASKIAGELSDRGAGRAPAVGRTVGTTSGAVPGTIVSLILPGRSRRSKSQPSSALASRLRSSIRRATSTCAGGAGAADSARPRNRRLGAARPVRSASSPVADLSRSNFWTPRTV